MILESIDLINFRNYKELSLSFKKGINYIFGNNGSGKTNIVEAINFLSYGRSFRTNTILDLIKINENHLLVKGTIKNSNKTNKVSIYLDKDGKKINIDNSKVFKISELLKYFNTIVFTPNDVNLMKESPNERRYFLNLLISRLNNEYRNTLSNYEKILKSRNDELKKDNIDINLIKALTYQLIDYSYVIYNYRKKYIDKLNELISLTYEKINNKTKDIKIIYKPFIDNLENYKKEALKLYNLSYKEDLNKKITTKGVHKEDFNIEVDNKDISKFGSQGENRMVILALKLSTYYLKNDNDSKPVVILDDVLSELDKNHEQLLIKYLNEFEQVFITGTGNINLSNTYEVKDNQVILSED
ncbi:MAG: DNA replication and repair protein RecF [Mollicutes bacterium]|nr:DNA replication and repair protein RecF [Mollicutes bacterium]MDD7263823.1 DNA replication and repair protein RecF [bacterium]MDY4979990.1 DNA replication and repair protein RecF [Candidatus Onthovivens sp.]